jgi:hypothetical protein
MHAKLCIAILGPDGRETLVKWTVSWLFTKLVIICKYVMKMIAPWSTYVPSGVVFAWGVTGREIESRKGTGW